jgi:hypothetical protein
MSPTLASNPLSRALSFILFGNAGVCVLDYGDKRTFTDLWIEGLQSGSPNIAGHLVRWNDPNVSVVIVGDDPSSNVLETVQPSLKGINFRDHLTPASWVAAWRLAFPDAQARIVLLGEREDRACSPVERNLRTLLGARIANEIPLVPDIHIANSPSLEVLCQMLGSANHDRPKLSTTAQAILRTAIWEQLTSDRDKHHAVSNVLGALLLSSQVGRGLTHPGEPWVQDCLLALVQACGVSADLEQVKLKGNQDWQRWVSGPVQGEIGAAVLIDDMADIWEYFLRGALGFAGDGEFRGMRRTFRESFVTSDREGFGETIQGLPSRLGDFLDSGKRFLTADVLVPGQHKIQDRFVLFLDLRLFPLAGASRDADEQARFLQKLAGFGLKLLDSGRNLPWLEKEGRNRFREELQSLQRTPSSQPSADSKAQALPPSETLLPRLLSLLDPNLPIVIFSSTHHADLTEPFRNYGNLITSFRKPTLRGMSGSWTDMVKGLHEDFTSALNQSVSVLRTRDAIQSFELRAQHSSQRALPASQCGHLVEMFFDESEEPTQQRPPRAVCAGGLLVIRSLDSNGQPIVSDRTMFDHLASRGCIWGWSSEMPADFARPQNSPAQRGFLPKGNQLDFAANRQGAELLRQMIDTVNAALGDAGCALPFATIAVRSQPVPDWMSIPHGVSPWSLEKICDTTLRRLVQHTIEGLLFRSALIRGILDNPQSRLAFDLGERGYPCQEIPSLHETFGFAVRGGGRWSFQSEDGYQLLAETVSRTGMPWPFKARIVRARAVPLRDFGNYTSRPTNGLLPKQLHYFADAVSHVALDDFDAATTSSDTIKRFFASGWIADFRRDPEEETRLAIGRAWEQGDRIVAASWAANLKRTPPSNGLGVDVYRELSEGINRFGGHELMQLIARLR